MAHILDLPKTQDWLGQFCAEDRPLAQELLASFATVSATEFAHQMVEFIRDHLESCATPAGLYAEREVEGKPAPVPLFKQTKTKPIRAYGDGPNTTIGGDVGSEGVIANIITQVLRAKKCSALSHPGPDAIRAKGIRHFILVTDFIGSGRQACRYLDAAWRVASVRSWASRKMISFTVLAY